MSSNDPKARLVITGPEWVKKCKKIDVLDSYMCYYDSGNPSGQTVIFLHGNGTFSYLWRNIISEVEQHARCIALDLIGMGHSGKSSNLSYRFVDHYRYFCAWLDLIDVPEKVVFVCHDWGSALAFHYCNLNQGRVKGLVHTESIVDVIESWDAWPEIEDDIDLIKSVAGDEMVLENNFFVEIMIPAKIIRRLHSEEMDAYRTPFVDPVHRGPTLAWPRDIPLLKSGAPDVVKIVQEYNKYLKTTVDVPKLFIEPDPGFFNGAVRDAALKFPSTTLISMKGYHFPQEDDPEEFVNCLKSFLAKLTD